MTKKKTTHKKSNIPKPSTKSKFKKNPKIAYVGILLILVILSAFSVYNTSKTKLEEERNLKLEILNNLNLSNKNINNLNFIIKKDSKELVLAKVNEKEITNKDVEKVLLFFKVANIELTGDKILKQTIIREALFQKTKTHQPEKDEIIQKNKEAFENLLERIPKEEINSRLKELNTNYEEYYQKSIERLKVDMTIKNYLEKEIYANLPTETLVEARHILICYDGKMSCQTNNTKEEAIETIQAIKQKLALDSSEQNFIQLAKEFSTSPRASEGGYLGEFTKGEMVKEFEKEAFELNKGEISKIIETDFGYHIIYLMNKQETYNKEEATKKTYEFIEKVEKEANIVEFI